jgi:hypothetical protein
MGRGGGKQKKPAKAFRVLQRPTASIRSRRVKPQHGTPQQQKQATVRGNADTCDEGLTRKKSSFFVYF